MMSFILMDRRAVKDNGRGIGLNVVLNTEKKDTQAYEAEQEYRAYSYIMLITHVTTKMCMYLP